MAKDANRYNDFTTQENESHRAIIKDMEVSKDEVVAHLDSGDKVRLLHFNLDAKALVGIGLEYFATNGISKDYKILHPFTYLAKTNGFGSTALKAMQAKCEKKTADSLELVIKKELANLSKTIGYKIEGVNKSNHARLRSLLDAYTSSKLFLPYSIIYELLFFIADKLKKSPNSRVATMFAQHQEWIELEVTTLKKEPVIFNTVLEDGLEIPIRSSKISYARFMGVLQDVMAKDVKDGVYLLFLINHIENVLYRKLENFLNGDRQYINFLQYIDPFQKERYMPTLIETKEWDFDKEIDPKAYYESLRPSHSARFDYFFDKRSVLTNMKFLKFPFFQNTISFELLMAGLSLEQVTYFLNNPYSFMRSPYDFGKANGTIMKEDSVIPSYSLEDIEIIIKKSGYNKLFSLETSITSYIKAGISKYTKENIYLDATEEIKPPVPLYYLADGVKYKDKSQLPKLCVDATPFYFYTYKVTKKYSDFLQYLYSTMNIQNFIHLINSGREDHISEMSFETFKREIESYILSKSDVFTTLPYPNREDNANKSALNDSYPPFMKLSLKDDNDAEEIIYKKIVEAINEPDRVEDDGLFTQWIKSEEAKNGFNFTSEQKAALQRVYTIPRIFVLAGYAGTGKSTIIKSVVARYTECGLVNSVGCALAGVAANRLAILTNINAQTIHSLLEYAGRDYFKADSVLNYDLIILDEASMIDTNLFKELISRIDFSKTSLIIVGDDAQLPPIGKGSPFADIISAINEKYITIPSAVLTIVQRNAGEIVAVANMVREGKFDEIKALSQDDASLKTSQTSIKVRDLKSTYVSERVRVDTAFINMRESLEFNIYKNLTFGEADSDELVIYRSLTIFDNFTKDKYGNYDYDKFRDIQIISPTKVGSSNILAVNNLNRRIQEHIFEHEGYFVNLGKAKRFYVGDKVIHVQNHRMPESIVALNQNVVDAERVYNGQIGKITNINTATKIITVEFAANNQVVYYTFDLAKELLELAYVLTAHKVQGNEFSNVINIIPFAKTKLGRNYIYSSFTRAKKKLYIFGKMEHFNNSIESEVRGRNTKMLRLFEQNKNTKKLIQSTIEFS